MTSPASSRSTWSSCSRACPRSGSCSPPIRRTACPRPRCTWRCASRRRPAWTRRATRGVLGGTMAALLDGGEPAAGRSRRGAVPRSSCRGAWRASTATPASSGPALFTGALEQARAMLDMAIAACRDPQPGRRRRGARDDRHGAGAAETPARRGGRRAPGDRPRLPRDRARGHRAARPRLIRPARQPHGRPLAAVAPLALAQPEARRRSAGDLVDLVAAAARRRSGGRARSSSPRRARAAADAAGWRARRSRPGGRSAPPSQGSSCARRSKRRTSIAHAVDGGVVARRPRRSRARVEPEHRRKPSRAAAIASTPEPVPTSSSGRGAGARSRPAPAAAPGTGACCACAARAERLPGVDHDLRQPGAPRWRPPRAVARAARARDAPSPAAARAPRSAPDGGTAPALVPVVGYLAGGDLDERVARGRLEVGQARAARRARRRRRTRSSPSPALHLLDARGRELEQLGQHQSRPARAAREPRA